MASSRAYIRFHGELNDHLPPDQRQRELEKQFLVPGSVKDLIESFGVPHPEVGEIEVNGDPAGFAYGVQDGDRIEVHPAVRMPKGEPRFVLDVHLGKLAAYLRMIGFDTVYRNCFDDPELVRISSQDDRILLTRDRGLLMHNAVTYGYFLRSTDSHQQLRKVVDRFHLTPMMRPFTRCMACNGLLAKVDKTQVLAQLPVRTAELHDDFRQCRDCRRIYWKGSHYRRMLQWVEDLQPS